MLENLSCRPHVAPLSRRDPSREPAQARGFQFYTEWNTSIENLPLDPERHALFERYARGAAADVHPWLFPLLESAGAKVLAGPRSFCIQLADAPGLWIDVPEMAQRLCLLPWIEKHEVAQ